jgi:hypothetical protein
MIKRIRAVFAAFFFAGTIFAGAPASAVPAVCVMPTSGTVSGLTLVQDINNCYGAALGLFAGGSAPGSPTNGMLWWNTSSGQVAQYDGTGWNNLWTVDTTNHLNAVQIGGGVQATVASAGTTDLWSVAASSVSVTGTASITQLANADAVPGTLKVVTFAGAATLTQGGGSGGVPLNLPNNGSNIVTAPGDYAIVLALTSTNVQVIHYERASGAALSTAGLNVGASALAQSAQGYGAPINLQLAAAVSGNNLTVTVLGVNGSNPSSTNPVLVNFRSTTLNNGSNGIVYGQITSALSFQVTSGNTMGCTTAVVCRLWVTLICRTESAGTCTDIRLGVSDQSTTTQVFPLAEDVLQTTGAGTSGGGTAGVIQANIASMTGVAIRIAGYVEVTWHTGTGWDTTPSKVQVFGPGVHKPGDVVQLVYAQTASGVAANTSFVASNITASITPTSVIDQIEVSVTGNFEAASAADVTAQIRRGASTNIGEAFVFGSTTSGTLTNGGLPFDIFDAPATTSATPYTLYFNSSTGTSVVPAGHIFLREIMGALDPPAANDDAGDSPPRALAGMSASTRVTARPQPDRARQEAAA